MSFLYGPGRLHFVLAGVLAAAIFAGPVLASGENGTSEKLDVLAQRTMLLHGRIDELSTSLSAFMPDDMLPVIAAEPTLLVAQSSREAAATNVRLGQLEEQLRVLNGQVEGLQFQVTQMQTLLQRLQEDYEFRFQQLEGGNPPKKTEAAPQSGSVTLPGETPQSQDSGVPGAIDLTAPDMQSDPGEDLQLGSSEQPLGTLSESDLNLGGQPLDLNFDSGQLVTDADADAQYKAGYDAVARGDYTFAEEQFRQFIALFPDHPRAPDATNWLGEALILRGANDEAADILLTGFQTYPSSPRAPDLLLRLGIALAGAGETDTACRTFDEVTRRYPDQTPAFKSRLSDEMSKAQC